MSDEKRLSKDEFDRQLRKQVDDVRRMFDDYEKQKKKDSDSVTSNNKS